MKITKRQLKRIIKEEKTRLLKNLKERKEPGHEYGDDNLKSTARLRKALESGELDWLDEFKSSAVMRHLDRLIEEPTARRWGSPSGRS
jgi:hypothetical protein